MRLLLCVLALLATQVPTRQADACSCMGPRIEAWPQNDAKAASNTHVFVRFPGGSKQKVILRLAGTKDTDGIPATRSDFVSMDVRFVELAPSVALAHGAKFEVVVGSGTRQEVISTFVVATKANKRTPKAPDIAKIDFSYEEAVCCTCSSGQPFVTIVLAGQEEDKDGRLYGVWSGTADGKLDWKRQPDAYVRSWYGRLILGDSSTCSANNFPIPKKGTMLLGVREISQAGVQSKGRIVSVEVKEKMSRSRFVIPKNTK